MDLYNINWKDSEDVLINNIETSAIIEDADSTLNYYADKYIVSKYKIQTGDIVEYAGIKYIIISQIDRNIENRDEKEYNYKARMRQADFNIKFIIGDKLYLFYSIVTGDKFLIQETNIIDMSADAITITLPLTVITKQINKEDCFIKWNEKWEIQGINYTKSGLIILNCKTIGTSHLDDKENEIADRWVEDGTKIDRLQGNITPIYPFTDVPVEPDIPDIPTEPDTPTIPETGMTYTITAEMPYADDVPEEIWLDSPPTVYTIHKFVDGVETSGIFTFEVTDTTIANITETTDNTISIMANDFYGKKTTTLIATDTETGEIAIEFEILMCGR